jgi:hypothetical protein
MHYTLHIHSLVTSYALYTITYCSKQKLPSIIISWVSLGSVYPIIENPNEEDSVLGKAIKQNSHYVITNNEGFPLLRDDPSIYNYDEIVVAQEAQILPAFILSLKKENMNKLLGYFKYSNFPGAKKKFDTYKVRLSSVRLSSSSSSSQDNMIEFSSVLDNDNETEALLSDNDLSNPLQTMNINNKPYYPPRISNSHQKEKESHKRITNL